MNDDTNATALPDPQAEARSLRKRLRVESRSSHERLDARFEGMADDETPLTYGRFLRVNEACHRAIEPILAASALGQALPGFALAPRSPALGQDLAAMGLAPIEAPAFPIPRPGVAEAVGMVYVIEGSRLGAGYILSRIRGRELGADWGPASFRYLEGPDTPHALRSFLIEASAVIEDEADVARAVAAADATFRYFLDMEALSRMARAGELS